MRRALWRVRMRILTQNMIQKYIDELYASEHSASTIQKYRRDLRRFHCCLDESRQVDKQTVIAYKNDLLAHYAPSSVNSMLVALNQLFAFLGWDELRIRLLRCQKRVFCNFEQELTRRDYEQLVQAARARSNLRLAWLLQTICATGIRVSELRYITVEALRRGRADIRCKGKERVIFIPRSLSRPLLGYCREAQIASGCVFRSKSGQALDRSNIWREMKRLCTDAGVPPEKVFPHNLRHLFARTFYRTEKDLAGLADILGHSSVDTTRIYMISSGEEHARKIERLHLTL